MTTPSSMSDLSTTAASNSPAGSDSPSTIDDQIRALASIVKQNVTKGTDITACAEDQSPAVPCAPVPPVAPVCPITIGVQTPLEYCFITVMIFCPIV